MISQQSLFFSPHHLHLHLSSSSCQLQPPAATAQSLPTSSPANSRKGPWALLITQNFASVSYRPHVTHSQQWPTLSLPPLAARTRIAVAVRAAEEVGINRGKGKEDRNPGAEAEVDADRIAMPINPEAQLTRVDKRRRSRRMAEECPSGLLRKLWKTLMMARSASSVPRESNTFLSPPAITGPVISVP
jgi:hypothetical protein